MKATSGNHPRKHLETGTQASLKRFARDIVAGGLRRVVFPGRYRLCCIVRAALGEADGMHVVPLRAGGKLLVDGRKDLIVYWLGELETGPNRLNSYLVSCCRAGMTVFDIGANIGVYTVSMALRVGTTGQIHAFEVLKLNFDILAENVKINCLSNVHLVQAAVSERAGVLQIPAVRERSEFIGNYSLASKGDGLMPVPAVSLDDYVREKGITAIDVMKLDIEGSEVLALKGAKEIFKKRLVKQVICEFNPGWLPKMGSSVEELHETLSSYGMQLFFLTRFSQLKPLDLKSAARAYPQGFDAVAKWPGAN